MSKSFHYKLTIYNLPFVLEHVYPHMKKMSSTLSNDTHFMLNKMVIEENPKLPNDTLCEIFFCISGEPEEMQPHIDYIESILENKSFTSYINIINLKDHVNLHDFIKLPETKWTAAFDEDQSHSLRYCLENILTDINHIPFNKRFFYPLSSYMADIDE